MRRRSARGTAAGIPTVAYVPPAESEPVVSNEPETQQTRAVADPGPTAPEASIDDDALIGDKSDPMAGRSFFDENPDVRRLLPDGSLDIAGLLRAYAGIEIVEKAEVPRYSAETHAWHPANVMRYSLKNFLVDHETGAPLNPRADHTMSLESYLKTAMRRDEPPPLPRSDEELRAEAAEYSAYLDELDSDENKFMDPTNDSDTDSEIDPRRRRSRVVAALRGAQGPGRRVGHGGGPRVASRNVQADDQGVAEGRGDGARLASFRLGRPRVHAVHRGNMLGERQRRAPRRHR
jgi:hypothetical protein